MPSFLRPAYIPNQKQGISAARWLRMGCFSATASPRYEAAGACFYARQNMLTQVGAITTNGVQQQSFAGRFQRLAHRQLTETNASVFNNTNLPPAGTPPASWRQRKRFFSKDYQNPRILHDQTWATSNKSLATMQHMPTLPGRKGVHLTRFIDPNKGCEALLLNCASQNGNGGYLHKHCSRRLASQTMASVVIYPQRCIRFLVSQHPSTGPWQYHPIPSVSSKSLFNRGFNHRAICAKRMSHRFLF